MESRDDCGSGQQWMLIDLVLLVCSTIYGVIFCAHAVRLNRCSDMILKRPDPVRRCL